MILSALLTCCGVSAPAYARQCLDWTIPAARENGTVLQKSELSAFVIRWERIRKNNGKTESGEREVTVKDRHCFGFKVPGLYAFQIKAVDTQKVSSQWSNTASKTVE